MPKSKTLPVLPPEINVVYARPTGLVPCDQCGIYFSPTGPNVAHYCSTNCRQDAYERRCMYKGCGKVFKPAHPSAKFCSANCRQMHSYYAKREVLLAEAI